MPSKTHNTREVCPRCQFTFLSHAHCAHLRCTYKLVICAQCDDPRAVDRVLGDHEKDCSHADGAGHVHATAA